MFNRQFPTTIEEKNINASVLVTYLINLDFNSNDW